MKRRAFLGTLLAAAGLGLAKGTGLASSYAVGVDPGAHGSERAAVCEWDGTGWHRCAILGNCPAGKLAHERRLTPNLYEQAWERINQQIAEERAQLGIEGFLRNDDGSETFVSWPTGGS